MRRPYTPMYTLVMFIVLGSNQAAVANILISPQNSTLPLSQNGSFHCISTVETRWVVNSVSIDSGFIARDSTSLLRFANQGIFFSEPLRNDDNYTYLLRITGNIVNNFTRVQCIIATGIIPRNFNFSDYPVFFLRVLGPPEPVVDLEVSEKSKNVVFFSWSSSFSPYAVSVAYEVQVEDENRATLLSEVTNSTSLLLSYPDRFCSILEIRIFASNLAGKSSPSNFTYSMLTKPNTAAVISSLQHTITFQNGEIMCIIEFDSVTGCPAYPVTHYAVFLQEVNGSLIILGPSKQPRFSVNSSDIRENSRYSYTVRAVNSINVSSDIQTQDFFTTDVQASVAFLTSNSVTVQCTFIPGSQSKGCHAKLVGIDHSMKGHNIERIGGLNSVQEEFLISGNEVLEDILVFDWERDGSIGNLSVPVDIMRITSTLGPSGLGTESPGANLHILVPIGAVLGGLLVLVLLFSVCAFVCYKLRTGGRSGRDSCTPNNSQHQGYDPSPYEVCHGAANPGHTLDPILDQTECLYAQISKMLRPLKFHPAERRGYCIDVKGEGREGARPRPFARPHPFSAQPLPFIAEKWQHRKYIQSPLVPQGLQSCTTNPTRW